MSAHSRPCHFLGLVGSATLAIALVAPPATAQVHSQTRPPVAPAAGQTPSQSKGIWEPLNYPDDVQLDAVFFANDQVGWAAGKGSGGFLLHTADAGEHWDVQLGDPHSSDPEISGLQFLDATHGWAVQGGQLMRTSDGTTWETIGPFVPNTPVAAYRFTSARDGFEIAGDYSGSSVYATHDGGRSWKQVYACATTLQFNGLTKQVSCFLRDLYFVSPRVGYAVGGGFNDPWAVVIKTVDGGATWQVVFATTDLDTISALYFIDENTGVIRLHDRRVFVTADGGQTWRGGTGSAEASIKFADPQVGWSCGDIRCSYSLDGGKSWTSRSNPFPADIAAYSVPRRDRVYVVGAHGMIYRYRVVPADYTAKGVLSAPLMPAYGGPILGQLQQMQTQVAALQTRIAAAPAGASGASRASASGALSSSGQTVASTATGQDATAGGGFTQDTSGMAGFAQSTSAAPSSPFVQSCCGSQVQSLQTSFSAVTQQVPVFTGQFRNLNLLVVGLNMFSDLAGRTRQIRDSFVALKQAADGQTASAALVALTSELQGTDQAIRTQFQGLSSATPASAGPATFQSSAIPSPANPTQPPAAGAAPPAAAPFVASPAAHF